MADDIPLPELLRQPVECAARDVAMRLLEQAERERHRLGHTDDPEGLHDFRVAVRRLRSWLRTYKEPLRGSVSGKQRDVLRAVAHASNSGRDAEVHIEWLRARPEFFRRSRRGGAEWLIERLQSTQGAAVDSLQEAVEGDFVPLRHTLAKRLEVYPRRVRLAVPEATFAAATAERLREQTRGLRDQIEAIRGPGDQETAHTARIAAKHLRYLLEQVAAEVEAGESMVARLKGLQDVLGALHDAHVFGEEVARALADAAVEHAGELSSTVLKGGARWFKIRRADRDRITPGLLAIASRLRDAVGDSFASFAAAWEGAAAATFWDEVGRAADSLRTRGGAPEEIERKYLLAALPDSAKAAPPLEIEQGYLPGKVLLERLRRVKDRSSTRFYRTVKIGTGMVRTEIEEETTRAVFDRMWPLTKGRRLKKRRHRVREGDLTWEIDDFADRKLVLAEVELPDRNTDAEIPKWLRPRVVRDVTDEEEYQNARLAR
jgi:CHAD domain-containing protein/CYTH domain-containing protein